MSVYIPPKPQLWLPFDEREGNVAYDKSGYGRNATVSGVRWSQYHRGMLPGSGCVLWLQMDEGSGDWVYDFSGYGNNGRRYGATWRRARRLYALEFDGVDDYVDCGDSTVFNFGLPFTLEAWVKPFSGQIDTQGDIIWKSGCWGFRIKNTREIVVYYYTGVIWVGFATIDILTNDIWSHVLVTFIEADGNTIISIYINGNLSKSSTLGGTPFIATRTVYLGSEKGLAERFLGLIGEARINNRVLREKEIKSASYRW